MEKQKQTPEQDKCYLDKLSEQLQRAGVWTALGCYLFMTVWPAASLAAAEEAGGGEGLLLKTDEQLQDSTTITLVSLNGGNYTVELVVPPALRQNASLGEGSIITVVAMAYSSTEGQTDSSPDVTASGRLVNSESIAANFLPLGTKVKIGQDMYTVWDRMNARYDNKYVIDFWYPTTEEALQQGVGKRTLEIVEIPGNTK